MSDPQMPPNLKELLQNILSSLEDAANKLRDLVNRLPG